MPPTIPGLDRWQETQFEKIWAAIRGLLNPTKFVVDPTILNPSSGTPNCKAIIGDLTRDNYGNSTGLTGWGLASFKTGAWVKL